jgi:uncharacterized membrane protein YcaP (DUF421 family)
MDIVLRATAIYAFLWLITRAVGKRELSQLSAFDLLLLVTLGDMVQQGVTQQDTSVAGAFLAVGTMAFWTVALSWINFRFRPLRPMLEGLPVVIIRDGALLEDFRRLERLTEEEVKEEVRNQGIDDLRKVRIGVLEADGKMSFLSTDGQQPQQQGSEGPTAAT